MKRKLLFAMLCIVSALCMRAQNVPVFQEKDDFSGTTVSSLTTFVPNGTTYTLELTGCTAGAEIMVPGGSFSYTPTTSGTVRFVRFGSTVYVYEGTTYKGTVTVSAPDDPTYPTGLTSASAENLIQNGGFEDTSAGTYTGQSSRWKPTNWNPYNNSKAASGDGTSVRNGSPTLTGTYNMLMHNDGYYLTQQLASGVMKNFTPYQISYKYRANSNNQAGAKYRFQVGSEEFKSDYFSSNENTKGTESLQTFTATFTTPATIVNQPYVQLYRTGYVANNNKQDLDRFDEFILVAATGGGIGITGATGATFLSGSAYAPEGVLAAEVTAGRYCNGTMRVTNPTFDTDLTGWSSPIGGGSEIKVADNKQDQTRYFYQTWNGTPKEGRMYQVIENLPTGTYELELIAFADQAGTMTPANTTVAVYAQGQEVGTTNSTKIRPNYVNSVNFTSYKAYAYVDASGKLEIGMRQYTPAEFRWLGMDNVTLKYIATDNQEEAKMLALYQEKWTAVKTACNLLSDDNYTNVKGAERANLTSALSASVSDIGDYATNAAALQTAYLAFKAGKTNWDLLATEIAKADALGASTTAAVAIVNNNEKTATDALQAVKDLKVTEYDYVASDYSHAVSLGSWNTTGPTGSLTAQHWSGESREYLEQSSAAYGEESWDIVYAQNLTLPAGNYVFKVAGRQANSDNVTLSLTVKNGETVLGTVADFPKGDTGLGINKSGATSFDSEDAAGFANSNNGRGWEWRYVKFTLADDATVNVSVEAHATAKSMWVSFCDATVQTDNEANIDLIEYNIAVAAANTNYYNNASYSNVTGSEKTTLKSCIDADPGTTTESIAAAQSALEDAIAAFSAAKDNYDALASVNANITATGTLSYADSEKKPSTYTVTSSTTSSDAATQVASLTTALRAYYESNALAEGVDGATDYTSSIAEATCEATATIGEHETYNNGTWTCSNVRIQTGAGYTDASDVTQDYYFDSNGQFWNHNATNARISQTVNDLPRGKYLLTVTSRASSGVTLTLTANGKSVNPVAGMTPGIFGNGWDDTSVEFTVGKAGTAEISFNGNNGGAGEKFFSVDRFRLVRIGNLDAVTLDEDETASIVAKTADVTLTRNIAADTWSTFVVPFDIDNTTLKNQFGDDVRVSEFSASDKTGVTFTPMAEPAITANKPVLVRVSEAKSNFTFNGVEIKVATPTFSQAGVNFVGNYGGDIDVPGGNTYIVKSNTIKKSTGEQRLKGFRAYFTVDDGSPVKAFFENDIFIDDEATGLVNLNDNLNKNEAIYNLAGQRVQKAQKGLYIVNGRKVVVK